jgi:hypothetical protein
MGKGVVDMQQHLGSVRFYKNEKVEVIVDEGLLISEPSFIHIMFKLNYMGHVVQLCEK